LVKIHSEQKLFCVLQVMDMEMTIVIQISRDKYHLCSLQCVNCSVTHSMDCEELVLRVWSSTADSMRVCESLKAAMEVEF